MPRYALDQGDLLRLVALASGVDSAKPDEAMAILRRAEYLSEEPALEPQTAPDLASARLPPTVIDGSRLNPKGAYPVTETGQAEAPAKPE